MAQRAPIQPKPSIQYRTFDVRAEQDRDGFDGHASAWWSVDSYGTAMKPGAFRKTLKERGEKIPLLWQHDPWTPIGKPDELKEDKTGLAFKASVVTDVRAGAEAMALLRADTPLGMSFGFETIKSRPVEEGDADKLDWSLAPEFYKSPEGKDFVRVIEEVRLWEISLVTFPANEQATITAVRSEMDADTLSTLLDAIKTDQLDDERAALVTQIVAAMSERAGADREPVTPLPDEARRDRDRQIELALINAKWGQFMGVQHGY